MKILHTADWHIGQFKGPVENGVNLRSLDTKSCLEYMVDDAGYVNPDIVCISGDIFHQEQIGPVRMSDEIITAVQTIEELSEIANLVIVMRGTPNHDGSGQYRVLEKMMQHNEKVLVVTKPEVVSTPLADIVCIPGFDKQEFRAKFPGLSTEEENLTWTKYISDMVVSLKAQCNPEVPNILMAHYTVPGCNMESGQTAFFTNFEPVIPREALQAADYDGVFLGHIHRPQKIFNLKNVFYSGAINAMNFNDEGQERGFYVHEFDGKDIWKSTFRETPFRKFYTMDWNEDDVTSYLAEGKLHLMDKQKDIDNSIVRVRYTCTSDQKKALNIPMLQNDLYDLGAFYVSGIEAEQTIDVTNRGLLSEESDPLMNLKKWLDEKCYKDADKIVDMAEPIIAHAMKQSSTAEIFGIFQPVSITVKNYRNYKDETFDFADVSFCSINGVNGAGKSSLFMDAIVDCLFEETREGDNKAWIRGTEDARSGMIEFVFDIGDKRFRVTRTRMKSGRATLNLSQMDDSGSEWLNLSKERIYDTQDEIEKVLGMDSMTFRSCALIMQDQYGLFLQAKKDERIAILGNLLGLGIYGVMELDARKKLADEKKLLMSMKEQVKAKNDFIASKGDPENDLEVLNMMLAENEKKLKSLSEEKLGLVSTMASFEKARENLEKANKAEADTKAAIRSTEHEADATKKLIESCDTMLKSSNFIRDKVSEYRASADIAESLRDSMVRYEAGCKSLSDLDTERLRYENIIRNSELRNAQIDEEIKKSTAGLDADDIDAKLSEIEDLKKEQEEIRAKQEEYMRLASEVDREKTKMNADIALLNSQIELLKLRLNSGEQSKKFIADSGCPVDGARCKFLVKAQEEVEGIEAISAEIAEKEADIEKAKSDFSTYQIDQTAKADAVGYHSGDATRVMNRIKELSPYISMKKMLDDAKLRIARLEAEKESNDKTIVSCNESMFTLKIKACRLTEDVDELKEKAEEYRKAKATMQELERFVEDEKRLPVYEERKKNAEEKLEGITRKLAEYQTQLIQNTSDLMAALETVHAFSPDIEEKIFNLDVSIKDISYSTERLQITKGTLLQKVEDIKQLKDEIECLNTEIAIVALKADRYEILKHAFSQDGVPHQIVRNIIPHITDTANNILGQMTGGTMGVEFVMERTVKGKDGDKATLDVLINEYGKTTLPYASKSGGEKVKTSLAVILALAEIKTSAAGIQLGMLFIDEPPFLDEDGTQAYVDSLETIRKRYPDVKIMAITHDEAMKARFSQSVTVIKTEEGSKVIY